MKKDEMAQIVQNRKKLSVKSMYFNRYLLVRYVSALFFFTNFYWLISLLMSDSSLFFIPLVLIIVFVVSAAEQVKIFSSHTNNAKHTKYYFKIQLVINIILLLPTYFSSSFTQLYPFLIEKGSSKLFILAILMLGIILSAITLKRLHSIKHNEDKHFERIKEYEQAIN